MVLVFQRRAKLAAAFPTLQSFAIVAALQFGIPAWADEVPVGFIRAYLPKDAKRTDVWIIPLRQSHRLCRFGIGTRL